VSFTVHEGAFVESSATFSRGRKPWYPGDIGASTESRRGRSDLCRRNTPRRPAGLGIHEQAEAVNLYRDGVSIRAISHRMRVGRKAGRTALVRAKVVIRS